MVLREQSRRMSSLKVILFTLLTAVLVILQACGDRDSSNGVSNETVGLKTTSDQGQAPTSSSQNEQQEVSASTRTQQAVLPFSKVETHLILGTGSVQGAYFPIGGVICRLLNRHKSAHNIRCSIESTAGSVYNLRELRKNNFGLVVSQSDWQYNAYKGTSTFEKDGPNKELRAVFALEADPITLIVRADSDIVKFEDLKNRVVSFGYARSLQHRIVNDLLAEMGWSDDDFKAVVRVSDPNQIEKLCSGDVEATLFIMSSLNDYLRDVDESCELKIVPIEGELVKKIIADKPYYRTGIIPASKYLNSSADNVQSFGLGAVFVASESTSVKAIYNIVKEVVVNIKDFKALHPSLETIELEEMPYAGIAIPLHDGAIRYYREARLLK